jgi:hypothetical protein
MPPLKPPLKLPPLKLPPLKLPPLKLPLKPPELLPLLLLPPVKLLMFGLLLIAGCGGGAGGRLPRLPPTRWADAVGQEKRSTAAAIPTA